MLRELAGLYRRELLESVLPFWMKHSVDREHGGFFTCLDRVGACFDRRKYTWMNGRQVWTLSRMYRRLEPDAEWLAAAGAGARFLRDHVFDGEGRCWFSLTADGRPAAYQRKPYGGVFVMLGFLEYAKASGDASYRDLALDLFQRIRAWIADPGLLGRPAVEGGPRLSGLAEIYVLCSMAIELLEDRPGDAECLAVLRWCLRQIRLHYEPRRRLLFENAPLDAASAATPEGRLICPGSIFEISWLLWRALDVIADDEVRSILLATLDGAFDFAWDREHGGLYYFLDLDGRPPMQLEWSMKLWWVHAEAIYASLNAYARTGDGRWLARLKQVHDWSWARFRDPEFGEWYGYLDRAGQPALPLKGNNYKGCFHIPRALLFSLETLAGIGFGPAPDR